MYLLALIYGRLWESASGSMKGGPFWCHIVPHKDRAFAHYIEVVPFPSDFIFSSVLGPFLRAGEEIGRSSKGLDLFKSKTVKFTCAVLQVQDNGY